MEQCLGINTYHPMPHYTQLSGEADTRWLAAGFAEALCLPGLVNSIATSPSFSSIAPAAFKRAR